MLLSGNCQESDCTRDRRIVFIVSEYCGQSPSKHPRVCREILALRATDRTGRCAFVAVLEMEKREARCRPESPSHQGPGMLVLLEHEDRSSLRAQMRRSSIARQDLA